MNCKAIQNAAGNKDQRRQKALQSAVTKYSANSDAPFTSHYLRRLLRAAAVRNGDEPQLLTSTLRKRLLGFDNRAHTLNALTVLHTLFNRAARDYVLNHLCTDAIKQALLKLARHYHHTGGGISNVICPWLRQYAEYLHKRAVSIESSGEGGDDFFTENDMERVCNETESMQELMDHLLQCFTVVSRGAIPKAALVNLIKDLTDLYEKLDVRMHSLVRVFFTLRDRRICYSIHSNYKFHVAHCRRMFADYTDRKGLWAVASFKDGFMLTTKDLKSKINLVLPMERHIRSVDRARKWEKPLGEPLRGSTFVEHAPEKWEKF